MQAEKERAAGPQSLHTEGQPLKERLTGLASPRAKGNLDISWEPLSVGRKMQLIPDSNHTRLFPHPQTNHTSQEVTVLPGDSANAVTLCTGGMTWTRHDGTWVLLMLEQKMESNPDISSI